MPAMPRRLKPLSATAQPISVLLSGLKATCCSKMMFSTSIFRLQGAEGFGSLHMCIDRLEAPYLPAG